MTEYEGLNWASNWAAELTIAGPWELCPACASSRGVPARVSGMDAVVFGWTCVNCGVSAYAWRNSVVA